MEKENRIEEIIHLCEVCEKPTEYYCIVSDDGDEFWYCQEHAKIAPNGDDYRDNEEDR